MARSFGSLALAEDFWQFGVRGIEGLALYDWPKKLPWLLSPPLFTSLEAGTVWAGQAWQNMFPTSGSLM